MRASRPQSSLHDTSIKLPTELPVLATARDLELGNSPSREFEQTDKTRNFTSTFIRAVNFTVAGPLTWRASELEKARGELEWRKEEGGEEERSSIQFRLV